MAIREVSFEGAKALGTGSAEALRAAIEHAAHLLPSQGPITAFVHHNTLHAFEDSHFHKAVQHAARLFQCEPYLSEERYRHLLDAERIRPEDIREVLMEDLGDLATVLIGRFGTRFHLRLAILQYTLQSAPAPELRWLFAETDALKRFRSDTPANVRKRMIHETQHWVMRDLRKMPLDEPAVRHVDSPLAATLAQVAPGDPESWSEDDWEACCLRLLWRICKQGAAGIDQDLMSAAAPVRHRDLLLKATSEDSDQLVHPLLIRLCAAFLDQGFASWPQPLRERGFYQAFLQLYRHRGGPPDRWLRGLTAELNRLLEAKSTPIDSVRESLEQLGVKDSQRDAYIGQTLLALRGWAGMMWQLETQGDRAVRPAPDGTLVEFLAVRLILERFAVAYVARERLGFEGSLPELAATLRQTIRDQKTDDGPRRAFVVFQLAQVLGWSPEVLSRLTPLEWNRLLQEIEAFPEVDRRRIFQEAYERQYRSQTLDAVAVHARRVAQRRDTPAFQVLCCLDEREESFRRHLEEVDDDCETFGAAGFYGAAIYYRGAADAHFQPLCPAIIKPQHYVVESVGYTSEHRHRRLAGARRAIGAASHQIHIGSRTFIWGAFVAVLGSIASIPLVSRVLFPRLTARVRRMLERIMQPPPGTQLQLLRTAPDPGPVGEHVGFTLEEMADIVERLLRDVGLVADLSPLVIVTGHGSSSLNNPHESAHDCGACGGARGGPNARAFAQMANDPRVRRLLADKGLDLPDRVYFVGAYHNTCDDSVEFFDLDRLPTTHRERFERAKRAIDAARARSAHERCRRFESAPLSLTIEEALRHVEGRAEDLAQTRPEYGHATNSLCFVGRRFLNQGLFLDRRAFLTSYDPTQDDGECSILTRILQAAVPVCAGISLEYYFSFVDPTGYGCGTKLPHNIAALLGVMDGAASDLRTGLPWQMVEIHEPMRLLFIIETTPAAMLQIMDRNEAIGKLCRNDWVQIALQDPTSGELHLFRQGEFQRYSPETDELPVVKSSLDWYRGWRDHLGYASIGTESPSPGSNGHPHRRQGA